MCSVWPLEAFDELLQCSLSTPPATRRIHLLLWLLSLLLRLLLPALSLVLLSWMDACERHCSSWL
jgi:hypothetical protein